MNIKKYFDSCKASIEKEYQKELDKLALDNEPEEILSAFDENDQYESERLEE